MRTDTPPADPASSGAAVVHALTQKARLFLFSYSPTKRRFTAWSGNAAEVMGLSDAVLIKDSNPFLRHVHPDDRRLMFRDFEAALKGRREYRAVYRWIRPDNGALRWLHCRAGLSEIKDDPQFEGIILDISDEISGPMFEIAAPYLSSHPPCAYLVTAFMLDADLRLIRINRPDDRHAFRFGDLAFRDERFRVGRPFLDCFSDNEHRRQFGARLTALLRGEARRYRTRIFEGDQVFSLDAAPIREAGRICGVRINVANISEIAAVERRLADLEKADGLRLLAAGVAHHFNNCLQGILGYAAAIERHPADRPLVERSARAIMEIVEQTSGLSRQLFKLGSDAATAESPTDLNTAVMAAVERTPNLPPSGRRLAVVLGNPPPAAAPRAELVEAIAAVLANAAESLGESGGITVKTFDVALDGSEVQGLPAGSYAKLTIADTGRGMDAETRRRCLDPFFTTTERDPRTGLGIHKRGLGLPGAYARIRSCGGALEIDSAPGLGTTVTIYLPAARAPEAEVLARAEDRAPVILIIDDDTTVRKTTAALLDDLGYPSVAAADCEAGLALLRRHRETLRLVLLDALMPKVGGAEAAARIRRENSKVSIIGFSGAPPEAAEALLKAGAAAVLRKPVSLGELRETVETRLGAGRSAA